MATTTNFGWETPDDTDLVKDGALAIRTLGNSIDTSLVDLKGGTTGQVLSKTSNTDMDFTWVTSDDANAIQNAIVDAKGDLIAASAADTPGRLAVGNNGETLVADSSASTGLRWQGSYAGGKNFLINGGFDFWQRSTSNGTAGYQTADRWYQNATQSTTFARESTTVPVSSTYSLKMTANVGSQQMWIQQPIESLSAIRLAGRTIAVSADVSASTSTGMTINVYSSTTVDNTAAGTWGSAITPTSGGSGTAVSGSFTRISGTYAIPSTAKSVMVQIITTGNVANGVVVYIGNAQAEIGSVPTAFTLAGGTLAGELAACQRYYYRHVTGTSASVESGWYYSSTVARTYLPFKQTMRIVPTADISSGTNYFTIETGGATVNFTTMTLLRATTNGTTLDFTGVTGGVTGEAGEVFTNNASAYVGFSAEL